MRSVVLIASIAALASGIPTTHVPKPMSFNEYMVKYNKHYDQKEFNLRKSLFEARVEAINAHNAQATKSHKQAINKFTDLTDEELKSFRGFDRHLAAHRRTLRAQQNPHFSAKNTAAQKSTSLPASVDWTTTGALSPVKNQEQCGSCWAFSGTEAVESSVFINTGKLFVLAPQLFVDCVQNPNQCGGSGGCEGATTDLLFEYVQHHGATNETSYPYTGVDGTCNASVPLMVSITGWADVASNSQKALMEAVVQQPVTIGVGANKWGPYSGGVLKYDECDWDIDHAVLLVGYGTDPELGDYWKIQNSWGPDWGEKGFIRIARYSDDDTRCEEDTKPSDGDGCKDGPTSVNVCGTCGILYLPSYPVGGYVL